MAFTDTRSLVHYVQGNATTAEVNAGEAILEFRANQSIQVVGGEMIARGGNATTATSVDLKDTAGTAIVAVACAVGGLTQDTQLDFTSATNVTLTTYRTPLTVDKGLKIEVTGADMTVATSVDYYVEYVYV